MAIAHSCHLRQAGFLGHINCVKSLLDQGVRISETGAVHEAAEHNYECLKLLLGHGADVNEKDFRGWTPLYYATRLNNIECIKLLLDKGADVTVSVNDETHGTIQTAFDFANDDTKSFINKYFEDNISIKE